MNESLIRSHLEYMVWADRAVLEAVSKMLPDAVSRNSGSSHGGILGTLDHMYRAERVWLDRVSGRGNAQIKDYPSPADLPVLAEQWKALHQRWKDFAKTEADFDRAVTGTTSTGQQFSHPLIEILLHVVNHSTLHRGQVVGMMRQGGTAPPNTDLIAFYRLQAAAAA